MKNYQFTFLVVAALTISGQSLAQTMCPDGSYVGGSSCSMAPDGSYVGGEPEMAPDGTYVGGEPNMARRHLCWR